MIVTKRLQDVYRSELDRLADEASSYVESYINALHAAVPEATVGELREAAKTAIDNALNAFGTQAGALSAELFEEIMRREGRDLSAEVYETIDRETVDKKVRYFAGKLVEGDLPTFARNVTDLTRFYVKREAFENSIRNCAKHDVRYARVPSGRETCAFCFMLSSRGFVYHTELTARGTSLHGMHQHCDCIIVPGRVDEAGNALTRIEGYDPDAMYARWRKCAETVGADAANYSYKNRQKIMDEVATRDWKWLYSDDSHCASEVRYLKPRESLTDNERAGVDHLAANGFSAVVNHEDPNAPANIDLTINGQLWEMKNVGDGKHSIEDSLRDARSKWLRLESHEPMRAVLTTEGRSRDFSTAIDEARRRLKEGEEAILADAIGNVVRIRK